MADKKEAPKKEKVINYHAGTMPEAFKGFETIETNPGFGADAIDRYQVYVGIPVPKGFKFPEPLEKASQAMYGISFLDFCLLAGKQIATRPNYKDAFTDDGKLKPEGHKLMQDLAVNYRPGRSSDTPTKKVQTKLGGDIIALATKLNKTPEEVLDMIAKMAK